MNPTQSKNRGLIMGASVLAGGVGSAIGYGIKQATKGSTWAYTAALGAFGFFSAAILGFSNGKTAAEKLQHLVSALFQGAVTFGGAGLSLGLAGAMQASFTLSVLELVEQHIGRKLDPQERSRLAGFTNGLAWMALSPTVGLLASSTANLLSGLRTFINHLSQKAGKGPLLLVIKNPGEPVVSTDVASLAFGVVPGLRAGLSVYTQLDMKAPPPSPTSVSSFDGTPLSMEASGACSVFGSGIGMLLVAMRDGELVFGAPPPWNPVDTTISRVVSMGRSGHVFVGPVPGMLMWSIRQEFFTPGGVLSTLNTPKTVIAVLNGAMTAITIGPMAHEFFAQIRGNVSGPPGTNMALALKGARSTDLEVMDRRLEAELQERIDETETNTDGDAWVDLTRDVSEGILTAFHAGALFASLKDSPLQLHHEALEDVDGILPGPGTIGTFFLGLGLQVLITQGVSYASRHARKRDDPQSQRTSSSLVATAQGGTAGLLHYCNVLGFDKVPSVAFGAGAGVVLNKVIKGCMDYRDPTRREYPQVDMKGEALRRQDLIPGGRGRKKNESYLRFQFEKYREHVAKAVKGPQRPQIPHVQLPEPPGDVDGGGGLPLDMVVGHLPPMQLQFLGTQPDNPPGSADAELRDALPTPGSSMRGGHLRVIGGSLDDVREEDPPANEDPENYPFITQRSIEGNKDDA